MSESVIEPQTGYAYDAKALKEWVEEHPKAAGDLVDVLYAIAKEHDEAPVYYEDRQDSEVLRDLAEDVRIYYLARRT